MPLDKMGKFHMNPQRAMAAGRPNMHKQSGDMAEGVGDPTPKGESKQDMTGDSTRTIITHNPDGTHSVEHHDGEETGPHEHIHEAMAHISGKHHPDAAHSHIMHHADGSHTSHHHGPDGVSGPHDHADTEDLTSHLESMHGGGDAQPEEEEDGEPMMSGY